MKSNYFKLFFLTSVLGIFLFFVSFVQIVEANTCSDCMTLCHSDATKTDAECKTSCPSCATETTTVDSSTGSSTEFANPLKYSTVEGFLGNVLTVGRQIIVTLAIIFMVIGALMYVTSAGNPDMIKKAKAAINGALIGLALGIAAPSFLKEIGNVLGWNGVDSEVVKAAPTLSEIATNVLNFLMSILGTISLIMLFIASIMYLTSAGDDDRIKTGKAIFKYAVFGIIIAMASLIITKQIALFFA
jgi:hypothetical protein